MLSLSSSVAALSPLAKKLEKILEKIDVKTLEDLLRHYPSRYVDLSHITPINELVPGTLATVKAKVLVIDNERSRWKRIFITRAIMKDETGILECVWFHQRFLTKVMKPGDVFLLSGKADIGDVGLSAPTATIRGLHAGQPGKFPFQMVHPEYEKVSDDRTPIHGARIVPIYPLTERLTQKQLRFLIKHALDKTSIPEWLPHSLLKAHHLIPLKTALGAIHFPSTPKVLSEAERRLKFDELFLLQLRNSLARRELARFRAPAIPFHEKETRAYVNALPFELTKSQKQAAWEIIKDIQKDHPMNRLLHGDVGSGKTVVASIPILNALVAGYQVAYMTPTEILAEQQFSTLSKLFGRYPFSIGLITSSGAWICSKSHITNHKSRREFLKALENGSINLVMGTHALIQRDVEFNNLGLVVVDEQHRFGVRQRAELLKKKGRGSQSRAGDVSSRNPESSPLSPHFLSMTATPIPRTLALTLYGDLDLSVITEMPQSRKPVITEYVPREKRNSLYARVSEELARGRQAFVVCPLIDPSDKLGVQSAKEEFQKITTIFSGFTVAMLHGRQKTEEKNRIMKEFRERKYHILVSTPVVEVGIDIPNASIIIIENAERFGLAQLHQLRGRVGRGEHQSYCYLLSDSESEGTKQRLSAVLASHSGLTLAEKDLELRGPGDAWGTKQSGYENVLYIARLTDFPLMNEAQQAAEYLMRVDPTLSKWNSVKLAVEKWERKIHPE